MLILRKYSIHFKLEKIITQIYNKEKVEEQKRMTKTAETLETVYIYIYIS